MSVQKQIMIRQPGGRALPLEIVLDGDATRLMCEGADWRGESPGAFLRRAVANAIVREHAATAAAMAWSERPYDDA